MKNAFLIVMMISLNFSCTHKRTAADFIELGKSQAQYSSVDEYLETNKSEVHNDSVWIKFMFLNNPFNLNEDNYILIYVNFTLVYRGGYKKYLELKGSTDEIFEKDKRMVIVMDILTDKNKANVWKHRFQGKTVFSWNKDYKIIYCGFFPTNEDVEAVYFIPQSEPME